MNHHSPKIYFVTLQMGLDLRLDTTDLNFLTVLYTVNSVLVIYNVIISEILVLNILTFDMLGTHSRC